MKRTGKVVVDSDGVPQAQLTQREELDARVTRLESQVLSAEERATYAEKEAALRKRLYDAQKRIRATQPPRLLDNFSPRFGGLRGKVPAPIKGIMVLVILFIVLLLIGKSCSG